MSHELYAEEFTETHWQEMQDFHCGDLPHQVEVSDWLKGSEEFGPEKSALASIKDPEHPSRVWLFRDVDERLVGFGALGHSEWRWTKSKDPWIPVSVIIWCGIHVDFQRDPYDPPHLKYSNQIMNELIGIAAEESSDYPVLGLFVQAENIAAIKLYERFKFISEGLGAYTDPENGVTYQKMALVLDRSTLLQYLDRKKMRRG